MWKVADDILVTVFVWVTLIAVGVVVWVIAVKSPPLLLLPVPLPFIYFLVKNKIYPFGDV